MNGPLHGLHVLEFAGLGRRVLPLDLREPQIVEAVLAIVERCDALAGLWADGRSENLLDGGAPMYNTYRCADACFSPVLDADEAPAHPHHLARQTFFERDGLCQPMPAPHLDRTPPALPAAATSDSSRVRRWLEQWGVGDAARAMLLHV
jgi:hypothetical protein